MSIASRAPIAAAAGAAVAWSAPALAPLVPALAGALGVRRRAPSGFGAAHLTFDDGPHPGGTPAVLDALAGSGSRATFFLVGEQVERYPALAREIVAAGHVVALHGQRHRCQLRLGPRALAEDLRRGGETIGEVTGTLAPLYRPPYGIFSPLGLALARRRGEVPWLWSRWGRDWRADATPRSIAELAGARLADGDVVLLHDADHYSAPGCWRATARALPLLLEALEARGLRCEPL